MGGISDIVRTLALGLADVGAEVAFRRAHLVAAELCPLFLLCTTVVLSGIQGGRARPLRQGGHPD